MKATRPAAHAPWRAATLAALFGLLLALLLFAPARWLAMALDAGSGGRAQLVNPRGTVWAGQADLLLTGGPGSRDQAALPQGVRWRLAPAWANGPALRLALHFPCCAPEGINSQLRPLAGGLEWTLAAGQSRWPTAVLAGLGTPWNTLQLDGELRLDSPGLQVRWVQGRAQLEGSLRIDALDVSSRLSTLAPLGSYRLSLAAPTGEDMRLGLNTLGGALLLSGEGQWVGGRLRFKGEAQASEDHEAALSNLLNIVGKRNGRRSLIALG
jgi:general secretion pathway protein N